MDITTQGELFGSQPSANAMYRTVVTHAPVAIVLLNQDYHFVYANPASIRLFGARTDAELIHRPSHAFIHEEEREGFLHLMESVRSDYTDVRPCRFRLSNLADQEMDVELTATSFVHQGHQIIQTMIRDVSGERSCTDDHGGDDEWVFFRRIIAQLADRTLNPLTVISGFLTLLKEGDTSVDLNLLTREVSAVKDLWEKLIVLTQNHGKSGSPGEHIARLDSDESQG